MIVVVLDEAHEDVNTPKLVIEFTQATVYGPLEPGNLFGGQLQMVQTRYVENLNENFGNI